MSTTSYGTFLAKVIDDAVAAARQSYADSIPAKLKGAEEGLNACRGLLPDQLKLKLEYAEIRVQQEDPQKDPNRYWEARCFRSEVEWVCGVISVALINEGYEPIVQPTARSARKAVEILGLQGASC